MTAEPTVFVIDDDSSVRKALLRLLSAHGLKSVGFSSAEEFLSGYAVSAPGCIVLDISMPGIDGLALQRRLDQQGSLLPIVFITGHGTISATVEAMKAGAVDFLTKPVGQDALLHAISQAIEKNRSNRAKEEELAQIKARLADLTPREREVLPYVVAGMVNKQIAHALGTVEKTIKVHRARMMQKLGVSSVAALVKLASKAGIAGPS